jgi:SAM-dependent methyltransferase
MSDPNAYYAQGLGVETYDLFTGGGLLEGDVDFYLEQARGFGGPILELACGTGRILSPLAQAGHDVLGLDLSRAMLDRAALKPGLAAVLRQGDMRDFSIERSFALIIIAARSFQHLVDPAGQRAALSCARRHLRAGGHLILDLFDPKFELLFDPRPSAVPPREARHPETGEWVRRSVVARDTDPLHQTVKETLRFEVLDTAGAVRATEETSWTLRWSLRQEIRYLFELCGFAAVAEYSDFKGAPPAYGHEQLWIARAI